MEYSILPGQRKTWEKEGIWSPIVVCVTLGLVGKLVNYGGGTTTSGNAAET